MNIIRDNSPSASASVGRVRCTLPSLRSRIWTVLTNYIQLIGVLGAFWAGADAKALAPTVVPTQNAESPPPQSLIPGQNLEFGADEYTSNLDTQETELRGNVKLYFNDRSLFADHVILKAQLGEAKADGNVVFKQGKITATAERLEVNMKTGLGVFYNAIIRQERGFTIEGKEIRRVADDRYRAHQGKISTCQGCPQAWSVVGSTMDIQIEEYAEVHHALFQIRDAPVAYFPVIIFPIKTKRQSGFLLPQYAYSSQIGSQLQIPYYWAINEYSDATFEYNFLTKGGNRLRSEYRLLQNERSHVVGQASILRNDSVKQVPNSRYGYSIDQRYQISSGWVQRFRGEGASDRFYTNNFEKEFMSAGLPTLMNEPSISWQNANLYHYTLLRLNKDNLPRSRFGGVKSGGPIDTLPDASLATASYSLWGPLRASTELRHMGFRRGRSEVDAQTGWIRTGDRSTGILRVNAPMNFFDRIDWDPRVELRGDSYVFDAPGVSPTAQRGRLFTDQRLSSTFYRVYQTDGNSLKALRHSITPELRHTYSPADALGDHPFFTQSNNPRFDIFDPRALAPATGLGTFGQEQRLQPHHIFTFGIGTRLVGRYGESSRRYEEHLGLKVERDVDLQDNKAGRLRVSGYGSYFGFGVSTEFSMNTKTGDSDIQNRLSYRHRKFFMGLSQKISPIEETYGLDTQIKFLGPLELGAFGIYNSRIARVAEERYALTYRSPSECWLFSLGMGRSNGIRDFDYSPVIQLSLSEGARGQSIF